jgi:hypothetical protein
LKELSTGYWTFVQCAPRAVLDLGPIPVRSSRWHHAAMVDYPALVLVTSLVALWAATMLGSLAFRRQRELDDGVNASYGVIVGAALTLLGLIIGFTFSMAVGRYEQRKNYEEEEANAIGTEYVRADLLSTADAARVHALLKGYLDQRILFYTARDEQELHGIDARTAQLQKELWATVSTAAAAQPTAVVALAVQGMNDVLNTQGYTQAAWWNRIPAAAWLMMMSMSIFSCALVGFGARNARAERVLLLVLPAIVALSFFLIADIDSPRYGVIRLSPQNLISLAESLRSP